MRAPDGDRWREQHLQRPPGGRSSGVCGCQGAEEGGQPGRPCLSARIRSGISLGLGLCSPGQGAIFSFPIRVLLGTQMREVQTTEDHSLKWARGNLADSQSPDL